MAKITTQLPSISNGLHNSLLGLNEGDYQHLTQDEKSTLEYITNKQNNLDNDPTNEKYPTVNAVNTELNIMDDLISQKLNIVDYNEYFQGKYSSLSALQTAKPTGKDGDYAIVDIGAGEDAKTYLWDSEDSWVEGGSSGAATTDALPEGSTNLYFQAARVLATVLNGISFAVGTPVTSADNILVGFGKVQKQINDLITSVSNIFQPNQLISSVPPTRSVNTFTFPASGYVALINKTQRTNTASFVTTIATATTDYKRVDLIWFKEDNTLQKVVGTESLTVAVRPDIPAGQVGVPVSFINVFGDVVEVPTPITNEISVQDSQGNEQFKLPETGFVRFKGTSFNNAAKQIEINPLTSNVIYLSSTGNDSTAEIENKTKPYLTLNAVVSYLLSQTHRGFDWYIETLDAETYTYNLNMSGAGGLGTYLNGFNITNRTNATIIIENNYEVRMQEIFNFSRGKLIYRYTDSTVLVGSGAFTNFARPVFRQDLETLEFVNTKVGQPILGRGVHRVFSTDVNTNYLNWRTLIVNDKTFTFADQFPNSVNVTIGTVNNYDTLNAKDIFFNYGSKPNRVRIGRYNNLSGVQQSITAINISITSINSPVAAFRISYSNFSLETSATFMNTFFNNASVFTSKPILNGNGNTLNLNHTIALPMWGGNTGNSHKISPGIDRTTETVIQNVVINVNAASVATCFTISDLRSGRFGNQTVFDNVILNVNNNKPILIIDNPTNSNADFQIIFKNSVDIYNNNYIVAGTTTAFVTALNKNFLVQELASIYHDYGRLNVQGIFPPITQYNTYNNIKQGEIKIQTKDQIIGNSLRSDYTYIIDGIITLVAGEFITLPTNGTNLTGYGFDVSKIIKNVAGEGIFKSAIGGTKNLIMQNISINSGAGIVFDNVTDLNGTNAIEFNLINFENCASLGTLNGFRQFTATTCGFYDLSDGLTLEGNWSGFKLTNSNIIGFASTGTLFKKGTATLFSNRFYIDLNLQIATGSKICDFTPSNFTNDKSLQVVNCYNKVNGVIDDTTTAVTFPNITPYDAKSYFVNNIGIKNSNNMPYGISTANMLSYADDAAAAAGGIVQVGETYIESSTGYFKKRLT